jgi:hypothetical protein
VLSLIERGLTDTGDCDSLPSDPPSPFSPTLPLPPLPCQCRAAMNSLALQRYLLHCGQSMDGGLRGKSLSLCAPHPHPPFSQISLEREETSTTGAPSLPDTLPALTSLSLYRQLLLSEWPLDRSVARRRRA